MTLPDFWTAYWVFTSFVFGAIVGSFLNVCIWRMPRGESLFQPPSHCPACSHSLRIIPDMVPLLSQLRTRSRCRYCGSPYSWRYFWVELITAVLFAAIYLRYVVYSDLPLGETERTWSAIFGMVFVSALIVAFFVDVDTYTIPNEAWIIAAGAGIAKDLFLIWREGRGLSEPVFGLVPVPLSILSGLLAFWLLWQFAALATAAFGKEAMGAADPTLLGAMGTFLIPWPLNLLAFLVAVTLGAVIGTVLMFRPQKETGSVGTRSLLPPDLIPPAPAADPPLVTAGNSEAMAPTGSAFQAWDGAIGGSGETQHLDDLTPPADESPENDSAEGAPDPPPAPAGDPIAPALPLAARWGRIVAVSGSWLALAALYFGLPRLQTGDPAGAPVLILGLAAGVYLIVIGSRRWIEADKEWGPAMDAFFEGCDPGPRYIPFGPYLAAGALVAMFLGRPILEWLLTGYGSLPQTEFNALPWD